MPSSSPSQRAFFYGWLVVAAAFIVLLITAGIRNTSTVLLQPLEAELGFCAHMIGAGLAAWLGGVMRDAWGDYTLAFLSAGVLGLIAAGLSLGIQKPSGALVDTPVH